MSASGDRREDKRNIEDENYSPGLGQKNVAVEAVAHRSVQQVLLRKVVGGRAMVARLMRSHAADSRRSALSCRGNLQAGYGRRVECRCVLQGEVRREDKREAIY